MSKWVVDIHGDIEGDYDIVGKFDKVIEDIKAEIDAIEINGQVDEHTMFIRSGEQVKNMVLEIIDKHTK